jgi:hypothetical protein
VTPGELAGSAGGTAGSKPISGSEVASGALSVVGQPNSTKKRGESRVTTHFDPDIVAAFIQNEAEFHKIAEQFADYESPNPEMA